MKRNLITLYLLLFMAALYVNCSDSAETPDTPVEITTAEVSDITYKSATSGGIISGGTSPGQRGVVWSTSSNPEIDEELQNYSIDGEGEGIYNSEVTALQEDTKYYLRAYVKTPTRYFYGDTYQFTTLIRELLTLTLQDPTEVTTNSATIHATISGGEDIGDRGICWSETSMPTKNDNHKIIGQGNGTFSHKIENLNEGVMYFVRAFVESEEEGTVYSDEIFFTTLSAGTPEVKTIPSTYITAHRANFGIELTSLQGFGAQTQVGLCWSTNSDATINDNTLIVTEINELNTLVETIQIFPLKPETKYYVRAYVQNQNGINYGEEIQITTRESIFNYFKAENPGATVFNGVEHSENVPSSGRSQDQDEAYQMISEIIATSTRTLDNYRITLAQSGSETVLAQRMVYRNSAGSSFNAIWKTKFTRDANDICTFTNQTNEGSNATTIEGFGVSQGRVADLERTINFFIDNEIIFDWDDQNSGIENGDCIYIIPVSSPEKFKRVRINNYSPVYTVPEW